MIFEVGRVCIKNKGKDKGKVCVVVSIIDKRFVMVDGLLKRRRSNVSHLVPTNNIIKVSKNSSKDEILKKLLEKKIISEIPKRKEKIIKKDEKKK